jgi:hypothetical protein
MMISQCPTFSLGAVLYGAYTRIQFCCFIYRPNYSVVATVDYQPTWSFITWGRTLVQPSPLGQAEPLLSLATTVRGAYYREGYGCVTRNKKATYNCIRVAPSRNPQRPERMCKRLHFVVCDYNRADTSRKQSGLSRTP